MRLLCKADPPPFCVLHSRLSSMDCCKKHYIIKYSVDFFFTLTTRINQSNPHPNQRMFLKQMRRTGVAQQAGGLQSTAAYAAAAAAAPSLFFFSAAGQFWASGAHQILWLSRTRSAAGGNELLSKCQCLVDIFRPSASSPINCPLGLPPLAPCRRFYFRTYSLPA